MPICSLRRYPLLFGAFCLVLMFTAGCGGSPSKLPGDGLEGKVVLTGSSTLAPLMAEIGLRFEGLHPSVRVDVQTGGSSRGIADTRSGVANVGMSSRALREEETEELVEHVVAYDGVAFLVHATNPVDELSDEQLLAIFTGEAETWDEVGGEAVPITVVNRAAGRSEVDLVTDYFDIGAPAIQADLVAGENQQATKTVAGDPSAIAYISVGAAQRDVAAGVPVKLLPLRGVKAAVERVAAGDFPLARPLVLLTLGEPSGTAATLLDYALSPEVDDLIESLAYVPPQR